MPRNHKRPKRAGRPRSMEYFAAYAIASIASAAFAAAISGLAAGLAAAARDPKKKEDPETIDIDHEVVIEHPKQLKN